MRITVEDTIEGTLIFENVKSICGCITHESSDGIVQSNSAIIGELNDIDRIKATAKLYDVIMEMIIVGFQMSQEVLDTVG